MCDSRVGRRAAWAAAAPLSPAQQIVWSVQGRSTEAFKDRSASNGRIFGEGGWSDRVALLGEELRRLAAGEPLLGGEIQNISFRLFAITGAFQLTILWRAEVQPCAVSLVEHGENPTSSGIDIVENREMWVFGPVFDD